MDIPLTNRKQSQERPISFIHDEIEFAGPSDEKTGHHRRINKPNGGLIHGAWELFSEYGSFSSIHGMKYFSERKRHWIEKIWWIFAFGLSLYLCGTLILKVYTKWDESPVIVSFAEKSTPVWEIPFPAVTICPETKANIKMLNFTDVYHIMMDSEEDRPYNLTDEELARMRAVVQVCDAHIASVLNLNQTLTDSDITKIIRELAPTFSETMHLCKFRNSLSQCSQYFHEIVTEEGLCFTFNVLNSNELYTKEISDDLSSADHNFTAPHWNLQNGYDKTLHIDTETFPYRVLGAGARAGLFVLLRLFESHIDYICRGPIQGFKILLHSPGEVPQLSKHYFRVPMLQEVLVSVRPNMITTSEGLRHYEPNRRQCFFDSEKHLRFFKVYTENNCELECLSNFTMKICGCVKFSMPRDNVTPVCGASQMECYNEAEDKLLKQNFIEGLSEPKTNKGCNCLPACTSITYDAEISQADFDWKSLFTAYRNPMDMYPGMKPSRLSIFFKENQFITSKRSELYGQTDFLANCGGLMGLFMGVSLLSIVEIIYFCTLRICCNLRTDRIKHHKINISTRPFIVPTIRIDKPDDDIRDKQQ